ncbi:hypothetical protein BBM03_09070 [Vibrio parahaemolyticus]|nr:hypothetical protein BBM03_09070 [Vibrio parahaemolyticus]
MKKTINNGNDEVIINIEVDEINTLETLTKLADAYVDISSRIDEYRADIDWNCPIEINVVTPEGSVSEEEMFMKFTSDPTLERRAVTFIYNIINYCKTTTLELWNFGAGMKTILLNLELMLFVCIMKNIFRCISSFYFKMIWIMRYINRVI